MDNKLRQHLPLYFFILTLFLLACTCSSLQGVDLVPTTAESITIDAVTVAVPTQPVVATDEPAGNDNSAGSGDTAAPITLDTSAAPLYGEVDLDPLFEPNPWFVLDVWAGGGVNATEMVLGNFCFGNVANAPTYRFYWSGLGGRLEAWFTAKLEGDDTTMIILAPDGQYWCNDDFDGKDPRVIFEDAFTGDYYIWLGTWESGNAIQGNLYISEIRN